MGDRILGIANPTAANGRARRYAARLARVLRAAGMPIELRFTERALDATAIAREGVREGADIVLSIGGDGTLNEVVNGFFDRGTVIRPGVRLGVAEVGTGRDFSRTTAQSSEPAEVLARLRSGRTRRIDVGFAQYRDAVGNEASRHFVNIAEFGSGGAVVEKVNRTTKILGGRMSFLLAILSTLPKYRNKGVRWRVDGGPWNEGRVNNFVVANGRYFGGGLLPAPRAEIDDGTFDVVVIGDIDFKTVRRHLKDLRRGTHLGLPFIGSARGRTIETDGTEGALLDLDGELVGRDPTRFTVVPGAIDMIV